MTGSMEVRMQAIRRRTVQKRRRLDRRAFACLSVFSLCLIAGIAALLGRVQSAGLPSVTAGYSAVLLRNGAGLYILVGLTAFAAGAALTLICIRLQNKRSPRTNRAKESEE